MKNNSITCLFLISFSTVSYANNITVTKEADVPGYPKDISDGNYVVGFANSDFLWPGQPDLSKVGYRWHEETGAQWLTFEGVKTSELWSVNDFGDAVGSTCTSASCATTLWKADNSILLLEDEVDAKISEYISENNLGSNPSNHAYDINNLGVVAGFSNYFMDNGARGTLAWKWSQADGLVLLPGGGERNLISGGEEKANGLERASSLNDEQIVVGGSFDYPPSSGEFATYWDEANQRHKIPVPTNLYPYGAVAMGVNNDQVVVGVEPMNYRSPWRYSIVDNEFEQLPEPTTGKGGSISKITAGGLIFGINIVEQQGYLQNLPIIWDTEGELYQINDYYNSPLHIISGTNSSLNNHRLLVSTLQEKNGGSYIGSAVFRIHNL
jgi:hypothetical protein